ncbi:EAL domain-containing protein [Pseudoteredinibacter isoporae]|uniref:Diguanylate cyclase (GGDEF)-like protein/PAS domain S-box-containing protein n=1 Tax=Pseudoteredinibacter isoporae TaxID=570281 RepID=A0A7X0JVW1_9GAMM|nr:diguanylate cyclase (GGDEF)-like protein/PAS domain S-box-containing protein [Pseudoteredinibacter isoporae]NHO88213.1 EAL domain-containing protein [Pseudoteredinibacter isoporae]NIB23456.1 EAL domain-containing protein [Pseudoteredinibacter isoporae]
MNAALPRPAILVTDDMLANRIAMRQILKTVDADIIEASSGDETLMMMLKHDNVALILLDINMPNMNGYEVAELLRYEERSRCVPIIFVTAAYRDERHEMLGYISGAVDYIEKPVEQDILTSKVKVFLQLHEQKQKLESLNRQLKENYKQLKIEMGERAKAEQSLRKLSEAVKQSPASVIIADASAQIEFVNPTFTRLTGYSTHEVLGKPLRFHQSGYNPESAEQAIEHSIDSGQSWCGELHNCKRDGNFYWSFTTISPLYDAAGNITNFLCIEEDTTVRHDYEKRLLKQANFDDVTDLPNRILALDRINQAFSLADRTDQETLAICPLFFIDVDGLRRINETLGHDAGDRVLVTISSRLKGIVRAGDTVARVGSDEFLIISQGINDVNAAATMATRILALIEEPIDIDEQVVRMSSCVGISLGDDLNDDPQAAIQNAESAMYRAKELGPGNYHFFNDDINRCTQEKLHVELLLHKAVEEEQLQLWFQPIVDVESGELVSAEALLRWHDQELGWVDPEHFVEIAETSGQINTIGLWVLRRAEFYSKRWRAKFFNELSLAVNVSVNQFHDSRLFAEVKRIYDDSQRLNDNEAPRLELEITERLLLSDSERIRQQLNDIRKLGFELSIDDFGTGYSSLSYLKRCPVNTVKIDKSFIQGLPEDRENATLVTAIVAMAHGLNLKVIAEGVESEAQWTFLKQVNCDLMQGFHVGRPMPAEDFESFLSEQYTERC